MTNEDVILSKFPPDFLEKYRYNAFTHAALTSLVKGQSPYRVLATVLAIYEDSTKEMLEDSLVRAKLGSPPQFIVTTQQEVDRIKLDFANKKEAILKSLKVNSN